MRISKTVWIALIVILTLCLAGCENDSRQIEKVRAVKIGAIYPFTGHSESAGNDIKTAIELATTIINQSFDLPIPLAKGKGLPSFGGAKVEIIFMDSQSDEKTAPELVEKLVNDEHAVAVMGCYNSAVTATASEQAEVMRIPFLNPESTSPVLIQRGLRWFFRTTPDDAMFAENFFSFLSELRDQLKVEVPKRLILVHENRLWGTSVARAEQKLARKFGYQVVEEVTYDAKGNQFEEELSHVRSSLPGIIFQSSYAKDAVLFMKGYKAQQINPVAILAMNAGFISPSFLENLGADGEYILSREVWALDIGDNKPLVTAVNELFKARFGRNMTGNSARAFTGLIVLADAIDRARSLDPTRIREALLLTDINADELIMPWKGVRFDPQTGQNILGKGVIVQVQQGQYVTVWPRELSKRKVVWPTPPWSERKTKG